MNAKSIPPPARRGWRDRLRVHRSAGGRAQARRRGRGAAGPGGGRGQHPARLGGERAGDGSRVRGLHGHARHRDQCPRPAGHPGEEGGRHGGEDGDRQGGAGGALYPAPRRSAPREGPHGHLRRRDGKPVLCDRYGGGAARARDRGQGAPQGDDRGRRLYRRSETGAEGEVPRGAVVPGRAGERLRRDGRERLRPLQGEQAAHRRVQHQPARRDGQGSRRRARRHDRPMTPTTPLLTDHVKQAKHSMDKAVEAVKREFSTVRTGKATTALLDLVRVEAYGSDMPLNQVASVAAPEPKLLTVQPWDKALLKAVEKAILASDLGLTPSNDGNLIRIPLPPLTEERRRELGKGVPKFAEEGRVAVRHARTEAIGKIKKTEHVSEDEKKHTEKDVQKLHDDHLRQVDEAVKAKEAEIMEV